MKTIGAKYVRMLSKKANELVATVPLQELEDYWYRIELNGQVFNINIFDNETGWGEEVKMDRLQASAYLVVNGSTDMNINAVLQLDLPVLSKEQ